MTAKKADVQNLQFDPQGQMPETILGVMSHTVRNAFTTSGNVLEIGNQASLIGVNKVRAQKFEQYYKDSIKQAVFTRDMKSQYGDDIFDKIPQCPY